MYSRERELQSIMTGLYEYRDHFRVPVQGGLVCAPGVRGVHANLGVSSELTATITATNAMGTLLLSGTTADHVPRNSLQISMDGTEVGSFEIEGRFDLEIPVAVDADQTFELCVRAATAPSMFDAGVGPDRRPYGFFLTYLADRP